MGGREGERETGERKSERGEGEREGRIDFGLHLSKTVWFLYQVYFLTS